jgi:peptide/nickel transport system substrate-binding protein
VSDPRTFNPFVSAEQNALLDLVDLSGASLLTRGPDSDEWLPYAAESFTVSEDNLVVEVVLRDGIKWSDGTPVTVRDYLFRFEAETDPEVGSEVFNSWFIEDEPILLEQVGEKGMRFTFPAPDRTAFFKLAIHRPLPDHILGEIYREGGAEALKGAWGTETPVEETVWTSPWIPKTYTPGERLVFERNPAFGEWNVDEQGNALPYLDTITTVLLADTDAALNLYLAGELDAFAPRSLDDIGVINVAVENGDIEAAVIENASPIASSQFIVFNWNKEGDPVKENLFQAREFRQAMSHLVDREAITELVYGSAASPMWTNVYQVNSFWVNEDTAKFAYDPEAAAELLAGLGFDQKNADGVLSDVEGNPLEFTLATNAGNTQREQIAQIFADSAREIGVDVDVQALDFNLLVDQLLSTGTDRPFDAILIGLRGGSRDWPFGSSVIPCDGSLHMYNQDLDAGCLTAEEQRVEELYIQGRQTLDTQAAREIGLEIQRIEAEQQPIIYTVSPNGHFSWLKSLRGEHPREFINTIVGSRETVLTFKAE